MSAPYIKSEQESWKEDNKELLDMADEAGLVFCGFEEDGEPQWVGEDYQFTKFEMLKEQHEKS